VIDKIHGKIADYFNKYDFPALTLAIPIDKLHNWCDINSSKNRISKELFYSHCSDFYWAIANVQIALGYTLVSRESSINPKGHSVKTSDENKIPDIGLAEIHFWHHSYCAWECIYRCWERIALIIQSVCYPKDDQKVYFDGLVNQLKTDQKYRNNPNINSLNKLIKHCNKVRKIRNRASHQETSPFKKQKLDVEFSRLLNVGGQEIPIFEFSTESLIDEIEKLKKSYLKIFDAFMDSKRFIDSI
jgi:hypothetical protein